MGENKYEEFFLKDDKNYPVSVYWDLYNVDHQQAIAKYEGHMFCPLCRLAPITVARGNERKYFKVDKNDMHRHDPNCSYKLNVATKKETDEFYEDLDQTDIKNKLVSCMNRMLKGIVKQKTSNVNSRNASKRDKNSFLEFTTVNSKKKRYLPHKNFTIGNLDKDIDIQKIFYGRCSLYIVKYIPTGETDIKKYYLKVLSQENHKQLLDISISTYVYEYIKDKLDDIPEKKENAEDYYLCFSGILQSSKYTYSCRLFDSRLIALEKQII